MASHSTPQGGFTTANVGRPRPSFAPDTSQTSVSSANDAAADLLREQQIERDRLQMDNFNLMMRVAVLEERLASTQSGYTEDFEAELLQKRVELEERDAKIRQQKEHMLRAVDAIEQLKRQLADAHGEIERLRALSSQSGELEITRQMVAKMEDELNQRAARARDAEVQLHNANEDLIATRTRLEEADDAKRRMEAELNQLRQRLQQLDVQQTKGTMQVEHLQTLAKQRDEQLQELTSRLTQAAQEKQQVEAKYQAQIKRMEEQMTEQVEKLRQEGEKYRTEFMRVNGERDKVHFERERYASDLENTQRDKARFQAEWERIAKEMDRVNAEADALRVQNAKLNATCEHQAQSLDSLKNDRENAADNLHKLESEANEWRKRCNELEIAFKTLEVRCNSAEAEVARLQERLESLTMREQSSTSEKMKALEQGKNTAESQNYELRMNVASLRQQLEVIESKYQLTEARANEESAKAREYKSRLHGAETDLQQHISHIEQLERQLTDATNSSKTEGSRLHEYSEQLARLAAERSQLIDTLTSERSRLDAIQKSHVALESQNQQLTNQFEALAREIQSIVGFGADMSFRSLDTLLKEAKLTLQRQFKAESDTVTRRYQDQLEAMRNHIDGLSSKLHTCHLRLETLQRTGLNAKDDAKSITRDWMAKYERLRTEANANQRTLEDALRKEQNRATQLESNLTQVRRDLNAVSQSHEGDVTDFKRELHDLKESNRLLLGELQERRRSAEHARKQYLQSVAENKDLLGAVDILKNGIMERDKQIEFYKATILRTTQQLQRGGSMADVKQKLLEQLEQTQFMVNETYKRWSHSELGGLGLNGFHNNVDVQESASWIVQLDESVGRLEVICDRWREYIQQSRDLQRRYGDAWRSAALSFGKGKERPSWVDDVERKCGRLLTESVRVSEAMRDVVEDVVNALQHARASADRSKRRSRSVDRGLGRPGTRDKFAMPPLHEKNNVVDDALSLEHFAGDAIDHVGDNNHDEVLFINRGKRVSVTSARSGNSRRSLSRGGTSAIYGHSLASLGRIGDELKTIEKKIKTYPDD